MKAIILAAGRGSRLNHITDGKPKCLVEIAGRTLLDWQTAALKIAGIDDITVLRGYMKELIVGKHINVIDNPRWSETNMVATLYCARDILAKYPAVVAYSDILYHPSIITGLMKAESGITITYDTLWESLWSERFTDPLKDAETFQTEKGKVTAIGEKTDQIRHIQGQYMGLLKFTPAGWQEVERLLSGLDADRRDRLDMTSMLRLLIQRGISVRAMAISGRWCEIDSAADLNLYQRKIGEVETAGREWSHDWRWH